MTAHPESSYTFFSYAFTTVNTYLLYFKMENEGIFFYTESERLSKINMMASFINFLTKYSSICYLARFQRVYVLSLNNYLNRYMPKTSYKIFKYFMEACRLYLWM